MPGSLQEHIKYLAAAQVVRSELGDTAKEASNNEEAARAMIELKKEDLEQGQYNQFKNGRIIRARAGVMPYNRKPRYFPANRFST
jgi:hypothetical protein